MRILAFDTATRATAVALADLELADLELADLELADVEPGLDGEARARGLELEARDDPAAGARPGHARVLLALIEQLIGKTGGWQAVDRIAVGIGPGTFTGLRIGIATAHALARAREIELVGVSTLAALALSIRAAQPDAPVLALLDARRGEVFAAAWAQGADPVRDPPLLAPAVLAPDVLATAAATILPPGTLAAGDGAVEFRQVLESAGVAVLPDDSALHRVSARWHCRLGASLPAGSPDAVLPAYLRLPDAELTRREQADR